MYFVFLAFSIASNIVSDSINIITGGSHLVLRLAWDGKEWKRWTCEPPHMNLLHSVKLYVQLKIGTEKREQKTNWRKRWNQSRFFLHLTQTIPSFSTDRDIKSPLIQWNVSTNFQLNSTFSNGSCRVQCYTHNRWGWRSDMDKHFVYFLQTCRNSHSPTHIDGSDN